MYRFFQTLKYLRNKLLKNCLVCSFSAQEENVTINPAVGYQMWVSIGAVSYTHLDVYKRQLCNKPIQACPQS